ncbi:hypothetical protein [Reyranella sp.]
MTTSSRKTAVLIIMGKAKSICTSTAKEVSTGAAGPPQRVP